MPRPRGGQLEGKNGPVGVMIRTPQRGAEPARCLARDHERAHPSPRLVRGHVHVRGIDGHEADALVEGERAVPRDDGQVRAGRGAGDGDAGGPFGRAVAEQVHEALRQLGGVATPREFVFMDRAAVGLGAIFLRLNAQQNWRRIFLELIDGFDPAALAQTQAGHAEALATP